MVFQSTASEITPRDLKKRLDAGDKVAILDVRESRELEICRLPNIIHIPLAELPARLSELEPHKSSDLVVYCRSGGRSDRACQFLKAQGFSRALNLKGGILAWSDEVDSTIQKY